MRITSTYIYMYTKALRNLKTEKEKKKVVIFHY